MTVSVDEQSQRFVAGSASTSQQVVATALVEARLPQPSVSRSTDPLVAKLYERGAIEEEWLRDVTDGVETFAVNTGKLSVTPGDGRVIDGSGRAHPNRFAFGYYTSGFSAAAFSRPRTNAVFFRQNDAAARIVLRQLQHQPLQSSAPTVLSSVRQRTPPVEVREVASTDPLAGPLFAQLAAEYSARYGRSDDLQKHPAHEFNAPDGALLLLLDDVEPIAGGAFRRYDEETAELKRIWTHTAHRRRGLARRVLEELEELAAKRGYQRLYLTTGPRQPEAKKLYLGAGYRPLFDVAADPESIGPLPFEKWLTTDAADLIRLERKVSRSL
jgi:GNAT superfamily N-acetyltransferase